MLPEIRSRQRYASISFQTDRNLCGEYWSLLGARRAVRMGSVKPWRTMARSPWLLPVFGSVSAYGDTDLEQSGDVNSGVKNWVDEEFSSILASPCAFFRLLDHFIRPNQHVQRNLEADLLKSIYQRGIAGRRVDDELECDEVDELFMFWSHTPRQPWQDQKYYEPQRRILTQAQFWRLRENR